MRALLDRLPDTVTLEDIQYHLDVVVKVLEAEASLERGEGIPHEEVKRHRQWFESNLDATEALADIESHQGLHRPGVALAQKPS